MTLAEMRRGIALEALRLTDDALTMAFAELKALRTGVIAGENRSESAALYGRILDNIERAREMLIASYGATLETESKAEC